MHMCAGGSAPRVSCQQPQQASSQAPPHPPHSAPCGGSHRGWAGCVAQARARALRGGGHYRLHPSSSSGRTLHPPVRWPPALAVRASGQGGDFGEAVNKPDMTLEEAYQVLGVGSGAGFEEVLKARNKRRASHRGEEQKIQQIEAAYDMILMGSMSKRIRGELEVSSSVRYADVPTKKRSGAARSVPAHKAPLQNLPTVGLKIQKPRQEVLLLQSGVFAGLGAWALVQALLEMPEVQAGEVAGLQLALAGAFAVYSFKENKKLPIGRSFALAAGCFLVGAVVGGLIENWLRVEIVPIGGFASPGTFVTEISILALWLGCVFLT